MTDNNTDGDKTRINDVDRLYDLIIMWDNPVDNYAGKTCLLYTSEFG